MLLFEGEGLNIDESRHHRIRYILHGLSLQEVIVKHLHYGELSLYPAQLSCTAKGLGGGGERDRQKISINVSLFPPNSHSMKDLFLSFFPPILSFFTFREGWALDM